jgi:hypothetical protein
MVKSRHYCGPTFRNTTVARVLSSILLVLILYGTTVEAAHRHGRVFPVASDDFTTSVSDSPAHNGRLTTTPTCNDCLICQLHQNFSSVLVNSRELDSPTLTGLPTSALCLIAVQAQYTAPRRGRAPPYAS